jgi:hypothetical protein
LLQIRKSGSPTFLEMDDDLGEASVGESTSRIDDVEFACLGSEKAIAPGLYDGSTLDDHGQVGLELTDGSLT